MGGGRGGSTKNTNSHNNNGGGGMTASGLGSIPSGSRKIVQSLKEIVNCPELEIYATLKECNMDPNETVNRLLSQDPFHEVKSKREKKKENKETSEFRPRNASGTSNRGRPTGDRFAGRGSNQYSSSDSGALHSRPAYKKDDGPISHANSVSSAPGLGGHNIHRQPLSNSDVTVDEDKFPVLGMTDNSSSVSQPSSGYQSSWVGAPGQVSMADIVKMGKPISKTPNSFHNINQGQCLPSRVYEDHNPKVSVDNFESGASSGHHVSVDDEWPLIEQPLAASAPSISKNPVNPGLHVDSSNLSSITANRPQREEAQQIEDPIEEPGADYILSAPVSDRKIQDTSGGSAFFEDELYQNRVCYQPQLDTKQEEEANNSIPVASLTANLQQLSIQKEDRGFPVERLGPSVVIPDHLQAQSVDCSHLSFGSFGSGSSPAFSGTSASLSLKSNQEASSRDVGAPSVGQVDNRDSEYYIDDSLRNESDAELFHRTGDGGYDSAVTQPEPSKVENTELEHGRQYAFPSTPGYAFENSQHANIGLDQSQANPQMQNLVSFPNSVPSYTDSLPNTMLAGSTPPGREPDIPYSPFPVAQSMAAKYGSAVSSISGPTISMAEALKTASFSSTQAIPQTISGGSIATGPALPQNLAAHPYSQHALPLHFPNMISYPLFTQGYTYAPPNYQPTFSGDGTYHQHLAAQYKNSVSVSSLPHSASIASGYGALRGSTTNVQGNFPMDPHTTSAANLAYEQLLNAQFKDTNRLMTLQQNDSTGSWLQGPGSRTMSSLPSAYYGYQGQSQQPAAGYRQAQQPSQNYGGLGYPNFYHSQTGMSLEHQQQNPRDGPVGGSQVQSQPSQQIWQNNY